MVSDASWDEYLATGIDPTGGRIRPDFDPDTGEYYEDEKSEDFDPDPTLLCPYRNAGSAQS